LRIRTRRGRVWELGGKILPVVNLLLTMFSHLGAYELGMGFFVMGIHWTPTGTDAVNLSCENASPDTLIATCLAAAAGGDVSAYFDLGVAFSTGSHGAQSDMIEAHKWFNLAAVSGHEEAQHCRAEVAEEMTAREIAEAQRRARAWIAQTSRRVA
jgi:hypothetical protein